MAILLSKHFAFDINFNFSDKTGRLLTCEINTENAVFHIFNIYAPNLCSDRKQFFDSFQNISYNHEDDSIYHYNIVLGDFNCILDRKIDRYPNRRTDEIGKIELQILLLGMIYMMHGESFTQIKNDILFKEGMQNHVLILFYVQMVYVVKCLIPI